MLLKAQIKRRTDSLQDYISSIQGKVYNKNYHEALNFIKKSRKSINNSYLASYDPNVYRLDCLRSKQDKIYGQLIKISELIEQKKKNIEKIKMRRGYHSSLYQNEDAIIHSPKQQKNINKNRKYELNLQQIEQIKQNQQFVHKISTDNVSIYATRFKLSLQDIHKVDFQTVSLSSNFRKIRITSQDDQEQQQKLQNTAQILFDSIISYQQCYEHVLISWMTSSNIQNYMIIKFQDQHHKQKWYEMIKLCKIIQQAKIKKTKIFNPVQSPSLVSQNINYDQEQIQESKPFIESQNKPQQKPQIHKSLVPWINYGTADRSRRQSEFFSIDQKKSPDKFRKISQDLTQFQSNGAYLNQRKLNPFKSQKSFDQNLSNSNSFQTKNEIKALEKVKFKKTNIDQNNINESGNTTHKNQSSQITYKNESNQIFMNSSIINWIQQQQQDDKSSKGFKFNNQNQQSLNVFHQKEQDISNHSQEIQNQHISQEPSAIQQSPMLPYNIRRKPQTFSFKVVKIQQASDSNYLHQPLSEKKHYPQRKYQNQYENHQEQQDNSQHQQQLEHQDELPEEEQSAENESPSPSNQLIEHNQQVEIQSDSKNDDVDGSKSSISQSNNESNRQSDNQSYTTSEYYNFPILYKGIDVLKCSIDGWNPHLKRLYMSKNQKQLHWQDLKSDEIKKVSFTEIQGVFYRSVDAGVTKHIKKNIQAGRCLTIKCHIGKKDKLLQFYLVDQKQPQQMEFFATKLKQYVQYKKNKS